MDIEALRRAWRKACRNRFTVSAMILLFIAAVLIFIAFFGFKDDILAAWAAAEPYLSHKYAPLIYLIIGVLVFWRGLHEIVENDKALANEISESEAEKSAHYEEVKRLIKEGRDYIVAADSARLAQNKTAHHQTEQMLSLVCKIRESNDKQYQLLAGDIQAARLLLSDEIERLASKIDRQG